MYDQTPHGGYYTLAEMSPLPPGPEFLREIFGELLSAVPARCVHIGGDEFVLDAWRDDPAIDAYRRQCGLASPAALHASSCARWPTCWRGSTASGPPSGPRSGTRASPAPAASAGCYARTRS